ncbi:MAG: hypothetical protein LBV40_06940 [Methanomicrobiales archaeon]|jgi:hypothetical protein|nr:hypothetical protein [Methanomicrobiales archaeon]
MDKLGLGMLIVGIICILAGVYGIYYFWDACIEFIKGGIGLAFLGAGCGLAFLGAILVKDEC